MSDAPLPLSYIRAIKKATELRRRGTHWSWPTIADAMEHYHGFRRSPGWWADHVGRQDRGLQRPRGNAFQARS
jgi:hypothetical protein